MNFNDFMNSPGLKKGLGIATVIFAGISAVASAITDQKKEHEFEDLKKVVSELQKK